MRTMRLHSRVNINRHGSALLALIVHAQADLADAGVEVWFNQAPAKQAVLGLQAAYKLGWQPQILMGTTNNNAQSAISAIDNAIKTLGLVQGKVGAGENKLQYAITLAQSQISSFSAAESQIRDADVAAQAANLTKAQVLSQTSIAAMAQANAEPQSVLKLLQ